MADIVDIVVDRNSLLVTMQKFRELNFSIQRQYLTPAVREAVKPRLPSLKAATPRNSGNLKRAAGFEVQKPHTKGDPNKYGVKVMARIGFLRGKDSKSKTEKKGFHAHLVESGVEAQAMPKRARAFAIQWSKNRKYQYLKPLRRRKVDAVFLYKKRAVAGQKFFYAWWNRNSRVVLRDLRRNVELYLEKAIAHQSRSR